MRTIKCSHLLISRHSKSETIIIQSVITQQPPAAYSDCILSVARQINNGRRVIDANRSAELLWYAMHVLARLHALLTF